MNIKAIETVYKGYKFRSRLEARWAVFFDALAIPWYYEYQGFDLGRYWYLPDFYLPKWKCYFEAKDPDLWLNEGRYKELRVAGLKCKLLSHTTRHKVILCFGGFGSEKADPMYVFMPGYNKNVFGNAIMGNGSFGSSNDVDTLFLDGYYPGSDIVAEIRSIFTERGLSPDFVERCLTGMGYNYKRRYLFPMHSSVGFNFSMIKEESQKIFAPFSDPLLCSFNASYFNKFKMYLEAYDAGRQARFDHRN